MTLELFKKRFEFHLRKELTRRHATIAQTIDDQVLLEAVDQAIAITLNGGKRLRPYLVDLMFRTAGGHTTGALTQAQLAVELFHVALLIHDDVMDRGTKRHHLVTVHEFVEDQLRRNGRDRDDAEHIGFSQAISIGDLFVCWACDLIHATKNEAVWKAWQSSFNSVIAGQLLDVDLTTRNSVTDDVIIKKMTLKTASYSVVGPLMIGRTLATNQTKLDGFIDSFSRSIGLAYQLQDDLFSWKNTRTDESKNHHHDFESHQHTLIRNYILKHGTKSDCQKLSKAEAECDVPVLHQLAETTGALTHCHTLLDTLFTEAQRELDKQTFSPSQKKEWQTLINTIKNRTS